jgi:TPR repeat protein
MLLLIGVCSVIVRQMGSNGYFSERQRHERAVERLANDGDVPSMIEAGAFYEEGQESADGTVTDRDYAKARDWYQKAVDAGSVEAMNHIGDLYVKGNYGIERDYAKAREWYEKAAAKDDPVAMDNMANLYNRGYGVEKSDAMFWLWSDRARTATAMASYHYHLQEYEKAANAGDVNAMNDAGKLYAAGVGAAHGVAIPKDYDKAREWFEKAVAKGSAAAMNNLGMMYEDNSNGAKPDYKKAEEWFEKAAAMGNRDAMCNLAELYTIPFYLPDPNKAKIWDAKCHGVDDSQAMH